jgi:hypothetical protein
MTMSYKTMEYQDKIGQSEFEAESSIVRGQRGTTGELRHDRNTINNFMHIYSDAVKSDIKIGKVY